jgi:hypothetical protein
MSANKMRTFDYCCDANRIALVNPSSYLGQFWPGILIDRLNKYFEDAATGQSNRKCIIVTDPVMFKSGNAVRDYFIAHFKESTFHTPATDTSNSLTVGCDQHGCTSWSGGGAPSLDNGCHRCATRLMNG